MRRFKDCVHKVNGPRHPSLRIAQISSGRHVVLEISLGSVATLKRGSPVCVAPTIMGRFSWRTHAAWEMPLSHWQTCRLLLLQSLPCRENQFLLLPGRFLRLRFGSPRTVPVPVCVSGLVSLQPLKEPLLRAIQPGIDVFRRLFFLHVLHNRELPDLLFHTTTSLLVNEKVIVRKRVSGNLCDGTKTGIKGNLSGGTCG